jgi:hypothetical protein
MNKVLLGLLAAVMFVACATPQAAPAPEPDLPEHKFLQLPDEGRLMNIECGQPCAVIFSAEANAYIALLLDGDTITFSLPE